MRRDVALMQGYADMLSYLPWDQQIAVLRIIARKGHELSTVLSPLLEQQREGKSVTVADYLEALERTNALAAKYRQILDDLRQRHLQRVGRAPTGSR